MTGWKNRRPPPVDEQIAAWTIEEPPGLRTLRAALLQTVFERLGMSGLDVDDLIDDRLPPRDR